MAASKDANPARRCGKAWKKNPGISPKAHNGHTVEGYIPATATRRALVRANAATIARTA